MQKEKAKEDIGLATPRMRKVKEKHQPQGSQLEENLQAAKQIANHASTTTPRRAVHTAKLAKTSANSGTLDIASTSRRAHAHFPSSFAYFFTRYAHHEKEKVELH